MLFGRKSKQMWGSNVCTVLYLTKLLHLDIYYLFFCPVVFFLDSSAFLTVQKYAERLSLFVNVCVHVCMSMLFCDGSACYSRCISASQPGFARIGSRFTMTLTRINQLLKINETCSFFFTAVFYSLFSFFLL